MPSENHNQGYTRRRWLRGLGAAAGLSAVAGCEGRNSTGTPTGTGTGDTSDGTTPGDGATENKEPLEPVLDTIVGSDTPPQNLQWNVFSNSKLSNNTVGRIMEFGALLNAKGELIPVAFEDWEYDDSDNAVTIHLNKNVKNWNGDRWTAEDMLAYWGVVHHQAPDSSQWKKLEAVDKSTFRFYYKEPQNFDLLKNRDIAGSIMGWNKEIWQPWVDKFKNAADQEERDQLTKELTQYTISTEEMIDKGLGTGAFKLDDVTETEILLKKWDGHRLADKVDIEEWRLPHAASKARSDELISNDNIDFNGSPLNQRFEGQVPEYIKNLSTWQGKWMVKMLINSTNREFLQDVNFRRAMAAVIDTEGIVERQGTGFSIEVNTGMDLKLSEKYVGDQMGDYIDYGVNSNPDLAEQYLEKAGYSRQDGVVVDENGEQLPPMRFVAGTAETWFLPAQVAQAQLKEFGFNVEFNSVERGTKLTMVNESMGDWDLSTESHYAGGTQHPISYFAWGSFWGWRLAAGNWTPSPGSKDNVRRWLEEGKEYSPFNGKPLTPEIPVEIGAEDLSGETKEVNIYELNQEMRTPVSEERTYEIVRDLSWAWNFHMPDIDLINSQQGCWGDTKNFDWPEDEKYLQIVNSGGPQYTVKNGLTGYNYK